MRFLCHSQPEHSSYLSPPNCVWIHIRCTEEKNEKWNAKYGAESGFWCISWRIMHTLNGCIRFCIVSIKLNSAHCLIIGCRHKYIHVLWRFPLIYLYWCCRSFGICFRNKFIKILKYSVEIVSHITWYRKSAYVVRVFSIHHLEQLADCQKQCSIFGMKRKFASSHNLSNQQKSIEWK